MRQLIEKISTYTLRFLPAFLIFTVPLFFLPITSDFFTINKQFLVYLTASTALIFFCLRLVARGRIRITLSPALLPFLFLSLIFLVSVFFRQPDPRFTFFGSTALILSLFIIFLSASSSQKMT